MFTPFKGCEFAGLGVFLDGSIFVSQGWGVGMQCKLRCDLASGSGQVVMMNSDPGMDQTKSLISKILEMK
jgi:hypothetical protein